MAIHGEDRAGAYRAYREAFRRERMPAHVRMGAAIAFAINTGFSFLDYVAYPESWLPFLLLRLGLNALFLLVYFRTANGHPGRSQIAICLSLAGAMLMMINETGAAASDYYAGLILLFVAMGVVFPLTAFESASICGAVTGLYALSPMVTGSELEWSRYAIHLVFLVGASIESIASCAFLDGLRFTDFKQRQRILEANEHLQEMDRLKSRFTANIHHELRTPLTLILAPIESLLDGEFGPVEDLQRGYLETARRNALRLLRLINELLELSRIESRDRRLRRRPVDAYEIAEELVHNAEPLAAARSIRLTFQGNRGVPTIHADRGALEKVLVNLLGNALKFTDRGDRVSVAIAPSECGIEIHVRDTGIGIPPDKLEHVFDRFAQLDASSTRRHEGTGIGLALSRELVDLHGGTINATSDGLGHGTAMRVWLPIGEPDADERDDEVSVEPERRARATDRERDALAMASGDEGDGDQADFGAVAVSPTAPRRAPSDAPEILVVEDNAGMRRLIAHHVGGEFKVRLATNGREGLEAIALRAPDLVLTDVMMPEMSGTELCRRLKSDPATRAIPVVLLTSKADREHKIQGLELGADDYINKPFHSRELLARIRSLTRLYAQERQLAERNRVLEETNTELEKTMRDLRDTEVQLIAQERLAAVGELAAGIAHEVNNPVNFACNAVRTLQAHVKEIQYVAGRMADLDPSAGDGLQAQVDELKALQDEVGLGDLADSIDELARIASEGLDRTSRLVGDFRDFARPRRNEHELVDLGRMVDSTVLLVSHKLREESIRVDIEDDGRRHYAPGDPRALSQVVLNLMKNAIDALAGRGGHVRVAFDELDGYVTLDVHDDGPGIDPAIMASLFDPFTSTKASSNNSGLGLSICRRILTQHGGHIEAQCPEEGGTRFRLTLPAPASTSITRSLEPTRAT